MINCGLTHVVQKILIKISFENIDLLRVVSHTLKPEYRRQVNICELKASLVYKVSSQRTMTTWRHPFLKHWLFYTFSKYKIQIKMLSLQHLVRKYEYW